MGYNRFKREENANREKVIDLLSGIVDDNLKYEVIASGCHIEVSCLDVHTLEVVEQTLKDLYVEQQIDSIRGSIRVTYNHFIKD